MTQFEISLTPFAIGTAFKPFSLDEPAWRRAVAAVEATGYRGNTFNGLDRVTTRCFAVALRQAIQQGRAREEDRTVLAALVAFLEGAGAGGTALSRGYKRLNRT